MNKIFLLLISTIVLFGAQSKFLLPEEAFKPSVMLNEKMQIEVRIETAKDIYIYVNSIKFKVKNKKEISVLNFTTPKSGDHDGDMVYLDSPVFVVDLKKDVGVTGTQSIDFEVSYQGCSKQGLCYQPLSEIFNIDIDSSKLIVSKESSKLQNKSSEGELSQSDSIADSIKSDSILMVILTFFGFGLLLSLTPCVFPMVPIISGIIISQGRGISTKKAFMLSLVYVLAMAVAYTIAGILAGLFGANLQAALQTPWVIYSFAGVFVALAMSMFGFYELKFPDKLVAKMNLASNRGGYVGVAIMGFLSALIVGPCVAAPLAGALVYIGQTGDAILGGSALFFMSIGMGIPLIAVGVSAGKFMPKPGAWMNMISAIFGVTMLGVAIWMLERIVDSYITISLYAVLGIGFAIYLIYFDSKSHVIRKTIAIVLLTYSVALLIGVLGNSNSMTQPLNFLSLKNTQVTKNQASPHLDFKKITSIEQLDNILAKNSGKKIMLDFTAKWCSACKELDEITFSDEEVKAKLREFVLIKADVTDNTDEVKKLTKKYGVFGPPALLFFNKNTKIIKSKTIVGFIGPEEFLFHLNSI
ncbi:MAG: protein-disulfide reductase DsbD [Sulfurimonas sp.]|nr:protein-disulfide reductase DsbD [Sulfurimonas sp.]